VKSNAIVMVSSAIALVVQSAQAGPILWNSPVNISGVTDVQTGSVFMAFSFGATGVTGTTINGVVFAPFAVTNTTTSVTVGNLTLSGTSTVNGGAVGAFGSASPPFSTLPAAYQSMLASSAYQDNNPMLVTLSGLAVGQKYQIEYWVNDSRNGVGNVRTDTLSDAGASTAILSENTGAGGGLGQYVIGIFTAAGATQSFTITGVNTPSATFQNTASQMNGLEVLAVASTPEPASMTLLGLGALALGFARLRKRA
jgi:hypothetical protein